MSHPPSSSKLWPEIRGHWWHGCVNEYAPDPMHFYDRIWREHGDFCKLRITPRNRRLLMAHPDAAERILFKNSQNYLKPEQLMLTFGESLISKTTRDAMERRKQLIPLYQLDHASHLMETINRCIGEFIEKHLKAGEHEILIHQEMLELNLRIATLCLFSRDLSGDQHQVQALYEACYCHMNYLIDRPLPFPFHRHSPHRRTADAAKGKLGELFVRMIEEHVHAEDEDAPRDILAELLSKDQSETQSLIADLSLLLAASYQTISATLSSTCIELANQAEHQQRAREEAEQGVCGNMTHRDLGKIPFAIALIQEGLRMFPVFNISCKNLEADEISGRPVPAGSRITIYQRGIHRHPDFWDQPDTFHPDRFLDNDPVKHRFAYVPFGAGPRICPGKSVALAQGPMVIANIVKHFTISPGNAAAPGTLMLKPTA